MDRYRSLAMLLLLLALTLLTGCNLVAAGAIVADRIAPSKVSAQYKGLANQSVGIMVWCDRAIRIDWSNIQIDCATSIQNKLLAAQHEKVDELLNTKFPVPPASIARYQVQYPQTQSRPITEIAPHLANRTGLTRLIYVEIQDFSTRPAPGVELFRGFLSGSIRVIDIKDGKATVVYEESDVHTAFPKKSPDEGTPSSSDDRIYAGTLDQFTTEIVHRFVTYEDDDD